MDSASAWTPGFVLHSRPYRESSVLVEILTGEHGRVGAVARGAKARKGAVALQPFQGYLLAWRGQRELVNLTAWESAGRPLRLTGTALVSGMYLNELLVRLTERNDPHPGLFDAYAHALTGLADAARREAVLRVFEKHLLAALGYGMDLSGDPATGEALDPRARYVYSPQSGVQRAGTGVATDTSVSGATLIALEAEQLVDAQVLREAKHLMRHAINHLLGGRPLLSRAMLR